MTAPLFFTTQAIPALICVSEDTGNPLWMLLVGWELAIIHIVLGLLFSSEVNDGGVPSGR